MARILCGVVLTFIAAASAFAQNQPTTTRPRVLKPVWEWSDDERIEKRVNPVDIRERAAVWRAANYSDSPQSLHQMFGGGPLSPFIVDGSRNPELLMPTELFMSLIITPDEEHVRGPMNEQIKNFGWDVDAFWKALQDASAEYLKLEAESLELQGSLAKLSPVAARDVRRKIESLSAPQCLARYNALQRTRREYSDFDRFLYTAVAPNIRLSSTELTASESFRLRFIEGGCQ